MELEKAEYAGFCYGVKRAIEIVENELEQKGNDQVYILGPLIHNPQVNEKLEQKGLIRINNLSEITNGLLVIPSHGVSPEILKEAKKKGIEVRDTTCPHVSRAQKLAGELVDEGYEVLIIGEAHHSEVRGIWGYTKQKGVIIENVADLQNIKLGSRLGVVIQTTQTKENVNKIVGELAVRTKELKLHNTICQATSQRQEAAVELAKKVDLMIILGGKNSANTKRLADICKTNGLSQIYHIEKPEEFHCDWLKNVKKIGITAGASTPDWLINEVVERILAQGEQ